MGWMPLCGIVNLQASKPNVEHQNHLPVHWRRVSLSRIDPKDLCLVIRRDR